MAKKKTHKNIPSPERVARDIQRTIKTTKDLPRQAKIAMVKGLRNLDFSTRKIQKITGIDKSTVLEYVDQDIDDRYIQYTDAMEHIFTETNDTLKILTANAMMVKVKDVENTPLRDYAQTYRVLNEVGSSKASQNQSVALVQTINVHPALGREKETYNVEDGVVVKPSPQDKPSK